MAAYAREDGKVYVDIETDSVCFPSLDLLWHWERSGEAMDLMRMAASRRVYVLNAGTVRSRTEVEFLSSDDGNYL